LLRLTEGYSGSDLTALARDAALGPIRGTCTPCDKQTNKHTNKQNKKTHKQKLKQTLKQTSKQANKK